MEMNGNINPPQLLPPFPDQLGDVPNIDIGWNNAFTRAMMAGDRINNERANNRGQDFFAQFDLVRQGLNRRLNQVRTAPEVRNPFPQPRGGIQAPNFQQAWNLPNQGVPFMPMPDAGEGGMVIGDMGGNFGDDMFPNPDGFFNNYGNINNYNLLMNPEVRNPVGQANGTVGQPHLNAFYADNWGQRPGHDVLDWLGNMEQNRVGHTGGVGGA